MRGRLADGFMSRAMSGKEAAGGARFSPAARHILESKGIDAGKIKGTAKGGRISKSDVILALKSGAAIPGSAPKKEVVVVTPVTTPVVARASATNVASAVPTALPVILSSDPTGGQPVNLRYTDVPNNNMRKIIAKVSLCSVQSWNFLAYAI